ncbi:hypothetical protein GCM10011614_03090 [Novosphingobium colocasiae]|uniref:Uncharacterized protein n=1 Tax=Novosphingobium colocasiae TaxID=1256513 RepID=A0A918P8L2_9SPHN|nr:hypothetical protein GCM10011614_03090 [Novosphingobium colocasiae]
MRFFSIGTENERIAGMQAVQLPPPVLTGSGSTGRAELNPHLSATSWLPGGGRMIERVERRVKGWRAEAGKRPPPATDHTNVALSPSGERYAGLAACRLAGVERGQSGAVPLSQPSPLKGRGLCVRINEPWYQ